MRKHSVVLESRNFSETVRVKMPQGFEVDEVLDPLKINAAFGAYKTTYLVKDGQLVFTRSLAQRASVIAVRTIRRCAAFSNAFELQNRRQ